MKIITIGDVVKYWYRQVSAIFSGIGIGSKWADKSTIFNYFNDYERYLRIRKNIILLKIIRL